jgi:serine phosphatase RsbU (regulator of sigma subunit)/pSer/pThr/pTyr-binding forkhead associated (FHA) protein
VIERGDYLELSTPGLPSAIFPVRKARVQIGRSSDSDIRLTGAYVSRRHARLERSPQQGWRVIDLGSSNGTFVNGRRADLTALADGDIIGIGSHRLVLHAVSARAAFDTATTGEQEIVPADATMVVADRSTVLAPGRLVPARMLTDLHQASRRLSRAADIPALLSILAAEFLSLLHPRRIAVGREDGAKCHWPVVIGRDGHPADASDLTEHLVPRVQALEGSIAVSLEALAAREAEASQNPTTFLFPVKAGERRLGHVYIELEPGTAQLADETSQFLSLLARQAALIWENLELNMARAAADELHHEMSAARQIQLRLFPDRLDLDPGLQIAAQNLPALAVSGDYYDFQLIEPGRVLFILADVMGHGLSAALLMAGVQAVFRTGVRAHWDLTELDQHIHHVVASSSDSEAFVVGVLGLCDLERHAVTLLSAGHPWPSIWSGDQAIMRHEPAYTFPWGFFGPRQSAPATFPLARGDWSIVAYTDGLSDSLGRSGERYGDQRLLELHHRNCRRPADELCEEILTDVLRSSDDSSPQEDDITLLVLRSSGHA